MKRTATLMIVGIATAATLALTGCSGSTPEKTPAAPPAQVQTPAGSTAPSASTESSPSAVASSTESAKPSDGDKTDKPSKSDVVDGLSKFYVKSQGLSKSKADKFAACMMDKMYDKADPQTLKAMKAGEPTQMNTDDTKLLVEAGTACQSALK